jgi:protein-S-isoprenylcysteine O-methyltransferase Ste14
MQWLPELKLGWLNGWLLLATFYAVFAILMLAFPRHVVARLYSIAGWSRRQRWLSASGKVFSLSCLAIIIFSPLKLGAAVFFLGLGIFALGFTTMIIALFDYRRTEAGRPVTQGLYRFSRNPQWLLPAAMLLGCCLAIGSWAANFLLLAAACFYHFRILGEERACLASYGNEYEDYLQRVPRYLLI